MPLWRVSASCVAVLFPLVPAGVSKAQTATAPGATATAYGILWSKRPSIRPKQPTWKILRWHVAASRFMLVDGDHPIYDCNGGNCVWPKRVTLNGNSEILREIK